MAATVMQQTATTYSKKTSTLTTNSTVEYKQQHLTTNRQQTARLNTTSNIDNKRQQTATLTINSNKQQH
jgi:hypothetical protein